MAHNKIGNKKKKCEKYKMQGRLEKNKELKQKRNEKRIEKFRRRREEGKAYVYDKDKSPKELPGNGGKTEYQEWVSIMAKLQREIDKKTKAKKQEMFKINNSRSSEKE